MLTVWKRHSRTCSAALAAQKIPLPERRFFKECRCACWVTGIHPVTRNYIKSALGTTSWECAEQLKRKMESGTAESGAITLTRAIDLWFADKRRAGTAETTMYAMYGSLRAAMLKFANTRGIVLLAQLNNQRTHHMVSAWKWKASTAARQLSNLRSFFEFAVKRSWLAKNPARNIERPRVAHVKVDPYTPDEEDRIDAALHSWTEEVRTNSGQWSLRPRTLQCLVHVLKDTGLRISDAIRVRPEIIERLPNGDGACTLVQVKMNGRWGPEDGKITVYLRRQTIEELISVPRISAKYPFMLDFDANEDSQAFKNHIHGEAQKVLAVMKLVGKAARVSDCRPHRFRHTFAVKKLLSGWQLEDVSRLLGHRSVEITEKYYGKWTKGRQDRLSAKIQAEWEAQRAIPQLRKKNRRRSSSQAA
jgi:site-specific recombinase XerD